jgi:hypothetical protein
MIRFRFHAKVVAFAVMLFSPMSAGAVEVPLPKHACPPTQSCLGEVKMTPVPGRKVSGSPKWMAEVSSIERHRPLAYEPVFKGALSRDGIDISNAPTTPK